MSYLVLLLSLPALIFGADLPRPWRGQLGRYPGRSNADHRPYRGCLGHQRTGDGGLNQRRPAREIRHRDRQHPGVKHCQYLAHRRSGRCAHAADDAQRGPAVQRPDAARSDTAAHRFFADRTIEPLGGSPVFDRQGWFDLRGGLRRTPFPGKSR